MLMVANDIRIGTVTTHAHLPMYQKISKKLIIDKINVLNQSLINDFAIIKPHSSACSNPMPATINCLGQKNKRK